MKLIKLKFLVVIIFLVFNILTFHAQTYYMANLSNYSQNATVTVNGFFLITSSQIQDSSSSTPMNPWIWKGTNTIKIHFEARKSDHTPSFSLVILKQTSDNKETNLIKFVYPPVNGSGKSDEPSYPFDKTITFELSDNSPSDFWAEAEPMVFDKAAKDAATDIVVQIFNAFQNKDLKKILELKDYQLKDIAKTYGQEFNEISKSLDESFSETIKSKEFKIVPFNKEDLVFNLMDNGKVFKVTMKDGKTPLTFGAFFMDVYIGKVKGKFLLVR